MAKGSFNGLYTFDEISKIYEMDSSNLRKMVQFSKFNNKEIRKFGKTWVITEDAVRRHFGDNIDIYLSNVKLAELNKIKDKKTQNKIARVKNSEVKDLGASGDDLGEVESLDYIEVNPSSVISSFNFLSKK